MFSYMDVDSVVVEDTIRIKVRGERRKEIFRGALW